jgi:hypothetical protein
MTSLTRYSSLFCKFLTGADLRRHAIRGDSIDGAAHFDIVMIASLAGILFGFDTAVIAAVTIARYEFLSLSPAGLGAAVSLRRGAHCSQQHRRRTRRSRRQPQHAASRRSRPRDLRTELRFRVERHGIRVASTPRRNHPRRIVDARTDISRVNRIELFPSMVSLQFIAAFFSMPEARGAALQRMNEQLRTAGRKVSRRNM